MNASKNGILQQLKNREITPVEGLRLFQALGATVVLEEAPRQLAPSQTPEPLAAPPRSSDIAVIGMSGICPGAPDLEAMWTLLREGRDCVGPRPESRRLQECGPDARDFEAGFLAEIDVFDPLFFQISPLEAEQMDPQQRLLLQESWKAFEDAGYAAERLERAACAVYIGCTQGDYLSKAADHEINPHSLTGRSISALAARISYVLNLNGPSLTVNTACSSSLTALVLACEALRAGRAELALAGGISIMTTTTALDTMAAVGMIAADARCRTFDQAAAGIVPGEAVGVVVLKRLADALRDRDPIHGVLKGYAINNDGKTNGLTAPSGPSQTALLLNLYRTFELDPNTIGYIEAHGTGTKLGDPIEVHALADAFTPFKVPNQSCAIGSIKTNIGHTLEASGLMGLFKVLLCLKHRQFVPSLHFQQANEHIGFEATPFFVATQTCAWPAEPGHPRRAGLSSFGMSGTNAHLVVEEAPARSAGATAPAPYLFPLSAKTPAALRT